MTELIDLNALSADMESIGHQIDGIRGYVLRVWADLPSSDDDKTYCLDFRADDGIAISPPWDYIDPARWEILEIYQRYRVAAGLSENQP